MKYTKEMIDGIDWYHKDNEKTKNTTFYHLKINENRGNVTWNWYGRNQTTNYSLDDCISNFNNGTWIPLIQPVITNYEIY